MYIGSAATAGALPEACFLAARRLAKRACLREARAARFCSAELAAGVAAEATSPPIAGATWEVGSAAGWSWAAATGSAAVTECASRLAKRLALGFTPKSSEANIAKLSTETAAPS